MKNYLYSFKMALFISCSILAISCSKDGDTGAPGPAGNDGTNGIDGNANVDCYFDSVVYGQWTGVGSSEIEYSYPLSAITQNILDSGLVISFCSFNSGATIWTSIPQYSGGELFLEERHSLGEIIFKFIRLNGSPINFPNPTITNPIYFKTVIITGHLRISNPNVNWNNYSEVKQFFNLKDGSFKIFNN